MALTVLNSPPSVALAKNPVYLRLSADDYIVTAGSAGLRVFSFTNKLKIGETIEIAWDNGNDITFTAAASPDDSGLQVTGISGTVAVDGAYWLALALELNANYLLAEDFIITGSAITGISLQLKDKDADFNPTITSAVTGFSAGGGVTTTEEFQTNFSALCQVYAETVWQSNEYQKIAEELTDPEEDGTLLFQFEDILWPVTGIDLPDPANIIKCINLLKKYYIRYAEQYGDVETVHLLGNSAQSTLLVLMAGLSYQKFPGNAFLSDYFTATSGRLFLTNQPRTKYVNKIGLEFLYYYNDQTTGDLDLMLVINYTDGTSSSPASCASITLDVLTFTGAQVYAFPAGYAQIGVDSVADPAKIIKNYQLHVEHTGTGNTSETFTFTVAQVPYYNNRYFMFRNSFGGFDCLWCTGVTSKGIDITREMGSRVPAPDYAGTDQQFFQLSAWFQNTGDINTGYKSTNGKAYIDYLQELLISDYVYEILPDNSYSPISIDDTSVELYKFDDNLYGLTFKARDAFNNLAY